jgi:hypothetical protein
MKLLVRIKQSTEALAKLKSIWKVRNINICSKIRLMQTIVISISSILFGNLSSLTVNLDSENR